MFPKIRPLLVMFVLLTLTTGVVYPLLVTGIAQLVFPKQANGSPVEKDGQAYGSALIGQDFQDPKYFWGRPSATSGQPYTAFDAASLSGSSGSNLGPLSQTLVDTVQQRADALRKTEPGVNRPIPVDLVTASASGLDPEISPAAAYYQVSRVARARGLDETQVRTLVDRLVEPRQFGFLGEPRVNVLLLNLALDNLP